MIRSSDTRTHPPRALQRSISLIGGPAYLALLALLFGYATETPFVLTAGVVFGCAVVVLAAIGLHTCDFISRSHRLAVSTAVVRQQLGKITWN